MRMPSAPFAKPSRQAEAAGAKAKGHGLTSQGQGAAPKRQAPRAFQHIGHKKPFQGTRQMARFTIAEPRRANG
jgi:hypothetical protein